MKKVLCIILSKNIFFVMKRNSCKTSIVLTTSGVQLGDRHWLFCDGNDKCIPKSIWKKSMYELKKCGV